MRHERNRRSVTFSVQSFGNMYSKTPKQASVHMEQFIMLKSDGTKKIKSEKPSDFSYGGSILPMSEDHVIGNLPPKIYLVKFQVFGEPEHGPISILWAATRVISESCARRHRGGHFPLLDIAGVA